MSLIFILLCKTVPPTAQHRTDRTDWGILQGQAGAGRK